MASCRVLDGVASYRVRSFCTAASDRQRNKHWSFEVESGSRLREPDTMGPFPFPLPLAPTVTEVKQHESLHSVSGGPELSWVELLLNEPLFS